MGLAGFYIIDDPADPQTLPSGARDVPLAITDRSFDAGNQIPYTFNPNGVLGTHILVNGRYRPYLAVDDARYRFRILNASGTRVYNLALTSGQDFTQIGTEAGLLPAPISRTQMRIGPGERLDVVIDFAGQLGQTFHLRDTENNPDIDIMEFRVTTDVTDNSIIPSTLRPLPDIGQPTVTRTFDFDRAAGRWTINGQVFDPERVDVQPVLGTTEKWIVRNLTGQVHTVHLHDVDQQCVSRNGGSCLPYETMKDTWFLDGNETIEIKLRFTDYTGRYVFHCHVLEHEQDGMMAQMEVLAPPDSDGDGWNDYLEGRIGTNPNLACGVDAWPADTSNDGSVQIDDVFYAASRFGQGSGGPSYSARAEIASQDGAIQIDDVFAFASRFGQSC